MLVSSSKVHNLEPKCGKSQRKEKRHSNLHYIFMHFSALFYQEKRGKLTIFEGKSIMQNKRQFNFFVTIPITV
jgi:hypothetical protein